LSRNEIGEQCLDYVFVRRLPVSISPRISNTGVAKKRSDVIFFKDSHVTAGFLFRNLDSAIGKNML
jgi:hypothetical protein